MFGRIRRVPWRVVSREPTDPACTAAVAGGGVLIGAPIRVTAYDSDSDTTAVVLVTVLDEQITAQEVTVYSIRGLTSDALRGVPLRQLVRSVLAGHADLEAAQQRTSADETMRLVLSTWRELRADRATAHRATAATAERLYLSPKYVSTLLTRARRERLL
jgi:hypothetical protein